jgi:hypothetical protein
MEIYFTEAWRVSWDALDARALWALDFGSRLEPSVSRGGLFHGLPRLRLWDDAQGFGCETDPTTLTVYELFTETWERKPVIREVVWRQWVDYERVQTALKQTKEPVFLAPTIVVRDGDVPAAQFQSFLKEASAFRVPITWFGDTESVTSDVGARGFEFFSRDQPTASLELTWSDMRPPEWDPVIEWYYKMHEFLAGCLQ